MQIIQQETDYDCGKACIAMLAGVSLQAVKDIAPDTGEPLTHEQEIAVLAYFKLGVYDTGDMIFPNYRGIITVPSLNFPGLNHAICFDSLSEEGIRVYDPQNGREGKDFYTDERLKCWSKVWNILSI